jgi:hypothetical protein
MCCFVVNKDALHTSFTKYRTTSTCSLTFKKRVHDCTDCATIHVCIQYKTQINLRSITYRHWYTGTKKNGCVGVYLLNFFRKTKKIDTVDYRFGFDSKCGKEETTQQIAIAMCVDRT